MLKKSHKNLRWTEAHYLMQLRDERFKEMDFDEFVDYFMNNDVDFDFDEVCKEIRTLDKFSRKSKDDFQNMIVYSQLLSSTLTPLRPGFGSFIELNGLEVPEDLFKEEFNQLQEIHYSLLEKLIQYKHLIQKFGEDE